MPGLLWMSQPTHRRCWFLDDAHPIPGEDGRRGGGDPRTTPPPLQRGGVPRIPGGGRSRCARRHGGRDQGHDRLTVARENFSSSSPARLSRGDWRGGVARGGVRCGRHPAVAVEILLPPRLDRAPGWAANQTGAWDTHAGGRLVHHAEPPFCSCGFDCTHTVVSTMVPWLARSQDAVPPRPFPRASCAPVLRGETLGTPPVSAAGGSEGGMLWRHRSCLRTRRRRSPSLNLRIPLGRGPRGLAVPRPP